MLTLMCGLDRNEWHPILACHNSPGISPLLEQTSEMNIETVDISRIRDITDTKNLSNYRRILRKINPDIFHANLNWPLSCSFGILSARLARVPVVIATQHLYKDMNSRRYNVLQKMISLLVHRYIAVSSDLAEGLTKHLVYKDRVTVVHNGIELKPIKAYDRDSYKKEIMGNKYATHKNSKILLTVARLDDAKGHKYLLDAAANVDKAIFLFAGEGPNREVLEKQVSDLEIEDRVVFLGHRDDIHKLLDICDIFVLPSLYEGYPLSIMEAMLACKPVVATDIPGTSEMVTDGVDGYLVPPEDSLAISTILNKLISKYNEAETIAEAGKEKADSQFSADAMVAKVTNIYNDLLR